MRRPSALPTATLRRLLRIARAATLEVSATVVRQHRRVGGARTERKAVGDFVTAVDLAAERQLRRLLQRADPGAGFLGEETGATRADAEFVWVVDPIDGTSNFASGLPCYAIAVACMHGGAPVAAALWCEPEGALYSAAAGLGAFRQGRRLRLGRARTGDAAMVGCQWHRGQQDMAFLAGLQAGGCRIRTLGSTVVQIADVVMGRLDGNVQQQGRLWDLVAPGLVLLEAGGRLTDWQGRAVFPVRDLQRGHQASIAAGPAAHRRLVAALRPFPDPNA